MLRMSTTLKYLVFGGVCVVALSVAACAGGDRGGALSPASPTAAALPTSVAGTAAGVDGPLIALMRAVANCGRQGQILDVLQRVFAGAGNAPAITFISDTGGVFTFALGTTVFNIFYTDNDGSTTLSCGDTVTGAIP